MIPKPRSYTEALSRNREIFGGKYRVSLRSDVHDLRFAAAICDLRFYWSCVFQWNSSHVSDLRLRFAVVICGCDFFGLGAKKSHVSAILVIYLPFYIDRQYSNDHNFLNILSILKI